MPHKIFDGQKVRPIFIEMGTKSMPEGIHAKYYETDQMGIVIPIII